jgi:hypothetical protein
MKNKLLGIAIVFLLSGCQKEALQFAVPPAPAFNTTGVSTRSQEKADTLADGAYFKLAMVKDSTNYDETVILFNHLATLNYDQSLDAAYFYGFGAESFFSLSDDGKMLAIHRVPYGNGLVIRLGAESKRDGLYVLKITDQKDLNPDLQIWLKDAFMKDSINLSSAPYRFQVNKIDTFSYGKNRFSLCLRRACN